MTKQQTTKTTKRSRTISSINDAIDKMRHSATRSLLTRRDVLIVASVSCIYGLGSPDEYKNLHLFLKAGEDYPREEIHSVHPKGGRAADQAVKKRHQLNAHFS